ELIRAEDTLESNLRSFANDIDAAVEELQDMLVAHVPHFRLGLPTRNIHAIIMALVQAQVATEYLGKLADPIRRGLSSDELKKNVLYITALESLNGVVESIREARTAEEAQAHET